MFRVSGGSHQVSRCIEIIVRIRIGSGRWSSYDDTDMAPVRYHISDLRRFISTERAKVVDAAVSITPVGSGGRDLNASIHSPRRHSPSKKRIVNEEIALRSPYSSVSDEGRGSPKTANAWLPIGFLIIYTAHPVICPTRRFLRSKPRLEASGRGASRSRRRRQDKGVGPLLIGMGRSDTPSSGAG